MSNILIGRASWTDKSLIASGRLYPAKCNDPEERLRYYASQFPLVEVDSNYYAMPKPEVAQLWAERDATDLHLQHQGVPAVHRALRVYHPLFDHCSMARNLESQRGTHIHAPTTPAQVSRFVLKVRPYLRS